MAKNEKKKPVAKKPASKSATKATTAKAKKQAKPVKAKKVEAKSDKTSSKRTGIRRILRSPFRGYFASSWRELKEVSWPDRKTTWKLTLIVILFSVIFSVFAASLDVGFEKLAEQVFLR